MPIDATNPAQQAALNKALAASRQATSSLTPQNLVSNMSSLMQDSVNEKRIQLAAQGPKGVNGINVPRHMWEGQISKKGKYTPGMRDINVLRAKVYGPEPRDPLTIKQVGDIHREVLANHFSKPIPEQRAAEKEALQKLRAAGHINHSANTLDTSEKLDTVNHEKDDKGRGYIAFASKGIAGHSLYSSGTGENHKFHIINTCPGSTTGCSGGVDHNGIVDTRRGTCFAPNAESQYVNASVRRACHEQAKHDPAMTRDWILAHTGSLRNAAENADKDKKVTLFRPNMVDETDVSSRHVIKGLNKQRVKAKLPKIIANSYGKTNEVHDPKNGYYVTYSNVGPKTKLGASIPENASRDAQRVRSTISSANVNGSPLTNEDGKVVPAKNSYMVTDVKRGSDLDRRMQASVKYAKYWSAGRPMNRLSPQERAEGDEGHFDGNGKQTTPDKAHYGHRVLNGERYDYQKQHILHPRLVQVGKNKDGSPHMVPTDSRFKDDDFLPKNRFKSKNGNNAGAILMTTPTESTDNIGHQSAFTHHFDESHVKHAIENNGEYEIDNPHMQIASKGNIYAAPQPKKKKKVQKAFGGSIDGDAHGDEDDEEMSAFPERSFSAQQHNAHRHVPEEEHEQTPPASRDQSEHEDVGDLVDRAMSVVAHLTSNKAR